MMNTTLTKICTKCGVEKELKEFHRREERPNGTGVTSDCKQCHRTQINDIYQKNIGRERKRSIEKRQKIINQCSRMRVLRNMTMRVEKGSSMRRLLNTGIILGNK